MAKAAKRKPTTYNRILKEFTKLNNKLPEDLKLSIQERRAIIKEQLLPKYKGTPKYKIKVKNIKADILKAYDKVPPKELCDLNYIDTSEYAYVEWYSLDETISELVPNCIYVKVSAGMYGETRIFNTRNYTYNRTGVRDIVENIRPDANNTSGRFIFAGYKKLRPRKRNDGTPENYYLDFVLFAVDKSGNEEAYGEAESVEYEVPKTRENRKKKTKVKKVLEERIKKLKSKKDSRRRAKQTLEKNIKALLKTSKQLKKAKNPPKQKQAQLSKQFNHSSELLDKYYKEGKLTKVQYEAALKKVLSPFTDEENEK
jgi:hypothetical protein